MPIEQILTLQGQFGSCRANLGPLGDILDHFGVPTGALKTSEGSNMTYNYVLYMLELF